MVIKFNTGDQIIKLHNYYARAKLYIEYICTTL